MVIDEKAVAVYYMLARAALRAARGALLTYGRGQYALSEEVLPRLLQARQWRTGARLARRGFVYPKGYEPWTAEHTREFEDAGR